MDYVRIEDQFYQACTHAGHDSAANAQQIATGGYGKHAESGYGPTLGHSEYCDLI